MKVEIDKILAKISDAKSERLVDPGKLSRAQKLGLEFCELIGEEQEKDHGIIEFSPILKLGEEENSFLRKLFSQNSAVSLEDFREFLLKLQQEQVKKNPELVAPSEIQGPTSSPPPSPIGDLSKPKEKIKWLKISLLGIALIAAALGGVVFWALYEPPGLSISEDLDNATALGILIESEGSEDHVNVHSQYVKYFGQDCFSRLYQPESAVKETSSIVVPVSHKTIAAAVRAAKSGDTVYLKPGEYYESIKLNRDISIQGLNCDSIKPEVTIVAPSDHFGSILTTGGGFLSISHIIFDGNKKERSGVQRAGLEINDTSVRIENCIVENCPASGVFYNGSGSGNGSIVSSIVRHCDSNGLEIANAAKVGLFNVESSENKKHGLLARDQAALNIEGCNFLRNTGGYGVELNYAAVEDFNANCNHNHSGGLGLSEGAVIGTIFDSKLLDNSGSGLFAKRSIIKEITNVVARDNKGEGVSLHGIEGKLEIDELTSIDNERDGVFFQYLKPQTRFQSTEIAKVSISNSTLSKNEKYGIQAIGPGEITISKTKIESNLAGRLIEKDIQIVID